jgi:electron transport complex protein RnfC
MHYVKMKPTDEIVAGTHGNALIINCEGCRELNFPDNAVVAILDALLVSRAAFAVIEDYYMCNPEHLKLFLQKHAHEIMSADTIIVVSCGVGVQTIAERIAEISSDIIVLPACDTYPLPGYQGITPSEHDCKQCGDCHLNSTAGICPITACTKSLINGQCGGAKEGKCEVDKEKDCGWERINKRLKRIGG